MDLNNNTVLSPINGHSERQTTLINGRFYSSQQNSGQTLIKNFLKRVQVISGYSCLVETIFCANCSIQPFFFLQLADTINNFEVILVAREEEYKKRFVKCFLNVIYFRHLEFLHCSSFFTVSNFLVNHWTIFS